MFPHGSSNQDKEVSEVCRIRADKGLPQVSWGRGNHHFNQWQAGKAQEENEVRAKHA
jgi:hypothetical protein